MANKFHGHSVGILTNAPTELKVAREACKHGAKCGSSPRFLVFGLRHLPTGRDNAPQRKEILHMSTNNTDNNPWYRDVKRSCSLKDSEHMGSTAKVVVLAAQA